MAFQDNAGGIVLDAVLTDLGRRKLAQGNFRVSKFALGDDEVDYTLGNRDTGDFSLDSFPPILESFATEAGTINNTLMNFARVDVMYIPQVRVNNLVSSSTSAHTDGFYYFAVNKETRRRLELNIGTSFVIENDRYDQAKLVIESGILPDVVLDIDPTPQNKESYIYNLDLYDKYYLTYVDTRFIENVLLSPSDSQFENDENDVLYMNLGPLKTGTKVSLPGIIDNYDCYRIQASDNGVVEVAAGSGDAHSMFSGPRSTIFALNLKTINDISADSSSPTNFRYSKFGETSYNLFGSSERYDFIESSIYIQGLSTNSTLNVPIRIVRYSGSV